MARPGNEKSLHRTGRNGSEPLAERSEHVPRERQVFSGGCLGRGMKAHRTARAQQRNSNRERARARNTFQVPIAARIGQFLYPYGLCTFNL